MENFSKNIDANLNKNYELFSNNYLRSFDDITNKDKLAIAKNTDSIFVNDKLFVHFFEKLILVDDSVKKMYILNKKYEGTFLKFNLTTKNILPIDMDLLEKDSMELDMFSSSIILHYLLTADGAPITGEWIQYRDLPDGMFYANTISGVLKPLLLKFETEGTAFVDKIDEIGGTSNKSFKYAGTLKPFKRFPILFIFEEKDEEFDAGIRVLFDKSASHYLKSDIIKTLLVYTVKKFL
jgi:hypothetical protein